MSLEHYLGEDGKRNEKGPLPDLIKTDKQEELVFKVVFMYPQTGQSDCVKQFNEFNTFGEVLNKACLLFVFHFRVN